MIIAAMITGAFLFAAGVLVGARLDVIAKRISVGRREAMEKLRKRSPLEGKDGLLSYRNMIRYRDIDREDDDE